MSTSIDEISCPNCGETAQRQQDNTTCEVYSYCSSCGWDSETGIKDPRKVTIEWCEGDVQTLRPDYSDEECQEALDSIGKHLRDRSIEKGWEIMEFLLDDYDREKEQDESV